MAPALAAARSPNQTLPRPALGRLGLWSIVGACSLAYFQPAAGFDWARWVTGALWLLALLGLSLSLGASFLSARRGPLWWDGWLGAGMLAMATVMGALSLATATGATDIVQRAPLTFLWAGLCPIAVGLSARMLPPLSGIRGPDRDRVMKASAPAPILVLLLAFALLNEHRLLTTFCGLGLGALYLSVFLATGKLLRTPESSATPGLSSAPPARTLRWSARGAWLCLAVGHLTLTTSGLEPLLGGSRASWATAIIVGTHLIGLGFIAGLALAVGQRVIPAWLAEDVRWPRLRAGVGVLWGLALGCRVVAELIPQSRGVLLHSALWFLLLGVTLLFLQVGRSLRPRGVGGASVCPSAPLRSQPPAPRLP